MDSQAAPVERYYTWRKAPSFIRPPHPIPAGNMKVLGLVGVAALLQGYDIQIFGLVATQMLAEFGRPAADVGPTLALFRLGVVGALILCLLADVIGRRQLLLVTMVGMALGTLATAFAPTYETAVAAQFTTRMFAYAEDMLCIVVIAEEFEERSRGWAIGSLGALGALGAGLAIITFALVNLLPHGWRGIYFLGAFPLLLIAWMRRGLPETRRFRALKEGGHVGDWRSMLRPLGALVRVYPARLAVLVFTAALLAFSAAPAISLMATYLQTERHFEPWMVSVCIVGTGLVSLLVSIMIGRLSDKVGRRPTLTVAIITATIGFGLLYGGGPTWVVIVGVCIGVFSQLAASVQLEAVTAELFPTSYRATASAARYIGGITAGAISLVLHGAVLTPEHGFGGAMLFLLAPLPMALIGVLLLPETAGTRLEDTAPGDH